MRALWAAVGSRKLPREIQEIQDLVRHPLMLHLPHRARGLVAVGRGSVVRRHHLSMRLAHALEQCLRHQRLLLELALPS